MSEHLKFLVSVDPQTGAPVKVEQLGEAGDLTPVDIEAFFGGLAARGAGASQQIVINIYGGGPVSGLEAGAGGLVDRRMTAWQLPCPPVMQTPGAPRPATPAPGAPGPAAPAAKPQKPK